MELYKPHQVTLFLLQQVFFTFPSLVYFGCADGGRGLGMSFKRFAVVHPDAVNTENSETRPEKRQNPANL